MSVRTKFANTSLRAKGGHYEYQIDQLSDALLLIPVKLSKETGSKHSGDIAREVSFDAARPLKGIIKYPDDTKTTLNVLTEGSPTSLRIDAVVPITLVTCEKLTNGSLIVDYVADDDTLSGMSLIFLSVVSAQHDMGERTRKWTRYVLTQQPDALEKAVDVEDGALKAMIKAVIMNKVVE